MGDLAARGAAGPRTGEPRGGGRAAGRGRPAPRRRGRRPRPLRDAHRDRGGHQPDRAVPGDHEPAQPPPGCHRGRARLARRGRPRPGGRRPGRGRHAGVRPDGHHAAPALYRAGRGGRRDRRAAGREDRDPQRRVHRVRGPSRLGARPAPAGHSGPGPPGGAAVRAARRLGDHLRQAGRGGRLLRPRDPGAGGQGGADRAHRLEPDGRLGTPPRRGAPAALLLHDRGHAGPLAGTARGQRRPRRRAARRAPQRRPGRGRPAGARRGDRRVRDRRGSRRRRRPPGRRRSGGRPGAAGLWRPRLHARARQRRGGAGRRGRAGARRPRDDGVLPRSPGPRQRRSLVFVEVLARELAPGPW